MYELIKEIKECKHKWRMIGVSGESTFYQCRLCKDIDFNIYSDEDIFEGA